jgi:energy-coupling factor transport system permease/ATP-binding protein
MNDSTQSQILEQAREQNELPLLLSLQDVSISYDGVLSQVVQNVNFSLHEGESVLFLGPSGCGKSTVAMLCGGLIPRSVEAKVTGHVWQRPDITEPGQIGYVFQDPDAQFCMLTVADEIAFGLENVLMQRDKMDTHILESLRSANLDVPFDANHASFSGGMKQKLAIASALALHPQLMIFDEPTANLDPLSTSLIFRQIAALHESKQTMIVIEHKFENLLPFMDRIVLFDHDGHIHRTGPTNEVIIEEWAWMVDEGIVDSWKRPIGKRDRKDSASADVQVAAARPISKRVVCHLKNVNVEFEKKPVLVDITLDIHEGEFVAVLGPNGAGKSTLLQTLAGLLRPQSGKALLFGEHASKLPKRKRQSCMAYCFQNPEFQFIYEKVGDELANKRTGDQIPHEVIQLLARFDLSGTEMQSPFSLSQGQKRRLSVAAMLKDTHDIFFLDEPTFGQDASTKEAIMQHLNALHADGKTVVMTTHDLELASHYATKVVVVIEGRIRFAGTFAKLQADKTLQREAHLLEMLQPEYGEEEERPYKTDTVHEMCGQTKHRGLVAPAKLLHPVWLLIGLIVATGITLQASTILQSFACFIFALVVMMAFGFMTPWKIGKLLLPFAVFYLIYIWSFAANAAIPAGAKSIHFLWMHVSIYGLKQGVILALRMLSSVLFGIFYILNTDMSDLMVGLSKDFRVPPKFAYGTLAGLRVVPLFTSEWTKLRQARELRGRDAKFAVLRPVVYSMPLLGQAVRMSERVAIAMEARGFVGRPASLSNGRTYYRIVKKRGWDIFAVMLLIVCAFLVIWGFR